MVNTGLGNYYYTPLRRRWAVYRRVEGGGVRVCDYATKEEARRMVYNLNGWKYEEK